MLGGREFFLVDTPGHVDFAAEMERAISVMDAAVLVLSCAEGVQGHTRTVWNLLRRAHVPTFLFLNKTDRAGADPERVLREAQRQLSPDIQPAEALDEAVAEREDDLLEAYLAASSPGRPCSRRPAARFGRSSSSPAIADRRCWTRACRRCWTALRASRRRATTPRRPLAARVPHPARRPGEPADVPQAHGRAAPRAGRGRNRGGDVPHRRDPASTTAAGFPRCGRRRPGSSWR